MKLCEIKIAPGSNFKHLPCTLTAIMLAGMCAKIACSCTWYLVLVLVLVVVLLMYFERLLPSLHSNRIHGEQPSRTAVFKNHNMNSIFFVASQVLQSDCSCAWKNVQDVCVDKNTFLPECTTSSMCTSCSVPPTQVLTVN